MSIIAAGNSITDPVIAVAEKHRIGVEIQEYATPDILDALKDHDLDILSERLSSVALRSLHGPFSELYPGSRDAEVRRVAMQRFQKAYELAARLSMQHLILHHAFLPPPLSNPFSWLRLSTEFWNTFTSHTDGAIEIHIENTYENDHILMADLIDAVDKPFFSACLDVGHCNAFAKQPIREWIEKMGKKIRYVHLHNNHGISDEHFGLTKGTLKMVEALELLRVHAPSAVWCIETLPGDIEPSIFWLEQQGFLK
jgi:sugar phosphate isomerase/epimerase